MSKSKLTILIYHRILDRPDPLRGGEVDVHLFDRQMKWVKRFFNVMPLHQAVNAMFEERLPERALAITFDDGYKDNYTNALPVLEHHGLVATIFVATGFLNGGVMWNDAVIESIRSTGEKFLDLRAYGLDCYDISGKTFHQVLHVLKNVKYMPYQQRMMLVSELPNILSVELPKGLMMDDKDIVDMSRRGVTMGAHTHTHPILANVDDSMAWQEIAASKSYIEKITDRKVDLFAYPNGKPEKDYTQAHVGMIEKMGFSAAVSTRMGVATKSDARFELPRFTPWDRSPYKYIARALMMYYR